MSSPKPNVKTGRQEGWKPEKSAGQGNHFSWHRYCQTAENLFPSATSHQPLLSALSLLVSLSASQSKTLFFCFIRASLYHLNTELLGTSARAKNSPLFLFFFFLFCIFGFICGSLVGWFLSFFLHCYWGAGWLSQLLPKHLSAPPVCHDGVCMGRGAVRGGCF